MGKKKKEKELLLIESLAIDAISGHRGYISAGYALRRIKFEAKNNHNVNLDHITPKRLCEILANDAWIVKKRSGDYASFSLIWTDETGRSIDKFCDACKHWEPVEYLYDDHVQGLCRRLPQFHDDGESCRVRFPLILKTEWCSYWEKE